MINEVNAKTIGNFILEGMERGIINDNVIDMLQDETISSKTIEIITSTLEYVIENTKNKEMKDLISEALKEFNEKVNKWK